MKSDEGRKKLQQLSFTEKIRILEKLRARSLAFAEARKKLQSNSHSHSKDAPISTDHSENH